MQPTGDYAITLERTEEAEPLGVTIVATCDQTYLVVEMQQNGLIPAWNCAHVEVRQRMVDLGDRILVVNGVFGNVGRKLFLKIASFDTRAFSARSRKPHMMCTTRGALRYSLRTL
eukprot:TRINITY_DN16556_c0_g1_i2.p1 TRINITY_DN16556_c0_g1~~TRINITY_DN16556_c0_g1_i2.p1  ORF type:complete len:115 (-),score=3.11 TRINITY_DN16556_c0_g1_i2:27-371(-)